MDRGPRATRLRALWLGAALGLAALAYSRSVDGEFVFDDRTSIEESQAIRDLHRYLTESFPHDWLGAKRPVTELTFALNYAAGRLQPRGYHLVNIALHLALAVLLWRLGALLLGRVGATGGGLALFAASAWAVHPLGSQAVSYVVQRSEVLASGFYVATIFLLLRADAARKPVAPVAAATLCAVLANGSKSIAVSLPAAFLLAVAAFPLPRNRGPWWRPLALVAPPAAVCAAFAIGLVRALAKDTTAGFHIPGLSPFTYGLAQARVVLDYLRLVFAPIGQNLDPDVPFPTSLGAGTAAAVVANLGLLAACAWLLRRTGQLEGRGAVTARATGFGALWFFVLLAPTSSVVPLVDAMAEHRAYLASWGVLFAAGAGAAHLGARWSARNESRGLAALAALTICALAATLWTRNAVWKTKEALWRDVIEKSPRKARGHMSLGQSLFRKGDLTSAEASYRTALALGGRSVARSDVLQSLAALLIKLGRMAEAEAALEEGLRFAPENGDLLNNLAVLLLDRGEIERAEALARAAIAAAPQNGNGFNTLGEVLLAKGQNTESLTLFERAIALDPDNASRHWNVAVASERLGRNLEACAALRRHDALEKNPAELAASAAWSGRLGCQSQ